MPAGVEANIFRAIRVRMDALAAAMGLPVAQPNIKFPPEGQQLPKAYLEYAFLPNATNTRTLSSNGSQQHRGIFQVSLHMSSQAATGIIVPMEKADQIIAHFPLGLILEESGVRVKIYRKPYGNPQPPQDGWLTVPVTIEYETYQP